MAIKFADQKIREVPQSITALDRKLNGLSGYFPGKRDGLSPASLGELREQHYRLRQERKKAYIELPALLGDEIGRA